VEVGVVAGAHRWDGVVFLSADPFGDLGRLAVGADQHPSPHFAALTARGLEDGAYNLPVLPEQAVHTGALLEASARFHGVVEQDSVEHDASRCQREGSGRAGWSLETAIIDPGAVPGDAAEPGGQDVVEHAQSLQRAHRDHVHEVGRHGVARELVAVGHEDPTALLSQQLSQARTGCASADDQGVVFGVCAHNAPILSRLPT